MRSRWLAWMAASFFWIFFGAITGFQVWISMFSHGHSVPLLLGFHIAVWAAWIVITAFVVRLTMVLPLVPPTMRRVLVHVLAAIVAAVAHVTWWIFLMIAMRPFDPIPNPISVDDLPQLVLQRLPLELALYCAVAAFAHAAITFDRLRRREIEAAQLETSLVQAQLRALELQIQPHFLFNTLNAISSLTRNGQNREAVVMIAGLSDLLRYTLEHSNEQRVRLADELAMLERYLEIQRSRFADRLTYDIEVEEAARGAAVPTLILQPLAENAIFHGISATSAPGVIRLRAFRERDDLRVEMFNSGVLGPGMRQGIGLRNTFERLRQLYGENGILDIRNAEGGVLASLSIPWAELR